MASILRKIYMDVKTQKLSQRIIDYSPEVYAHCQRMALMAAQLYQFSGLDIEKEELVRGTLLHDVGKITIPKNILMKPGPLNSEEREIVNKHPENGLRFLDGFSQEVQDICLLHHKKCNGDGYPPNINREIPDYVKFVTTLDIYDAMTNKRCYKPIIKDNEVLNELNNEVLNNSLDSHFVNLLHYLPYVESLI